MAAKPRRALVGWSRREYQTKHNWELDKRVENDRWD